MSSSNNPFYELTSDIKGLLAIETFRVNKKTPKNQGIHSSIFFFRKTSQPQTLLNKSRQV